MKEKEKLTNWPSVLDATTQFAIPAAFANASPLTAVGMTRDVVRIAPHMNSAGFANLIYVTHAPTSASVACPVSARTTCMGLFGCLPTRGPFLELTHIPIA